MSKEFQKYVAQLTPADCGLLFCLPSFVGQVVAEIDGSMDVYERGTMMDMVTRWNKIDGDYEELMRVHADVREQAEGRIRETIQRDSSPHNFGGIATILGEFAVIIGQMPNTLTPMEDQRRAAIISGEIRGKIPVGLRSRTLRYVFDICIEVAARTGGPNKISPREQTIIEMIYDSFGMDEESTLNLPWSRAEEAVA